VSIRGNGVSLRDNNILVSLGPWYFLSVVIQHSDISPVISTTQGNNLVFPMSLLPQQLVDLVIQISDLIIRQTSYTQTSKLSIRVHTHDQQRMENIQSWIFDTFLLISRRISPLHRSHSRKLLHALAILGLRSPRVPRPSSAACASRKRYSIDCAFSSLRA
jgi:hypothetical protein